MPTAIARETVALAPTDADFAAPVDRAKEPMMLKVAVSVRSKTFSDASDATRVLLTTLDTLIDRCAVGMLAIVADRFALMLLVIEAICPIDAEKMRNSTRRLASVATTADVADRFDATDLRFVATVADIAFRVARGARRMAGTSGIGAERRAPTNPNLAGDRPDDAESV